ncbi:MAG: hypothetical protein K0Q49_1904 [Haloplasmataceae bacterium]|nr:hypothetical protein [Haloplasmataceae bacterium]
MYFENFNQFDDPYNIYEYWDRQQQGFPVEYMTPQMGEAVPFLAPPSFTPPIPAWQVGPQGIRRCINRNTYIWLTSGNSFWFFPTFVSRQSLVGFRWSRIGWTRSFIELRRIRSYQCF